MDLRYETRTQIYRLRSIVSSPYFLFYIVTVYDELIGSYIGPSAVHIVEFFHTSRHRIDANGNHASNHSAGVVIGVIIEIEAIVAICG